MKNYSILRHSSKKFHSFAEIATAEAHNKREMDVPNADPDGKHIRYAGRNRNASDILKERLEAFGIKPRKNAVLANEYVLTFSPEMKGKFKLKDWVNANIAFMEAEHGKEGVLSMDLHLDETTPHLHVLVAPFVKKEVRGKEQWRLSGKDFWGSPQLLRERQDRYAEAMQPFGLQRGIKDSKAFHKDVKEYYKEVNKALVSMEKDLAQINAQVGNLDAHKQPGFFNPAKAWNALMATTKNIYGLLKSHVETVAMLRQDRENLISELQIARETVSRVNQKYKNSDLNKLETSLQAAVDKASSMESQRNKAIEIARQKLSEKDAKIEDLSNQNEILNNILDRYQGRDYNLSR